MKSLKKHIAVILPLIILLFSLQFTIMSERIVENYSNKLNNEYSIVIVAPKSINKEILKSRIKDIKGMEEISSKKILDKLKGNISSKNISLLQIALPKFYSIKLKFFPDEKKLENIKSKILKTGFVSRVETFSKTYTKTYRMFVLLKTISMIFSGFIIIVSLLLMFKQMTIWLLEHKDRMAIMTLFGATFWMKSAMLYRLAIVDSILSGILVSLMFIFLPNLKEIADFSNEMDIIIPKFDYIKDTSLLVGVSVLFSFLIVSIVISKMKNK